MTQLPTSLGYQARQQLTCAFHSGDTKGDFIHPPAVIYRFERVHFCPVSPCPLATAIVAKYAAIFLFHASGAQ
jgi:hypothetical protein